MLNVGPLTVYSALAALSLTGLELGDGLTVRSEALSLGEPIELVAPEAALIADATSASVTAPTPVIGASIVDRRLSTTGPSSAKASALANTRQRLLSLASRIPGPGEVAVSRETAEIAMQTIRFVDDYPVPQVSASLDGELGLTWFGPQSRVEVLIDAEGHFTSLARVEKGFVDGDDFDWDGTQPSRLPTLLKYAFA